MYLIMRQVKIDISTIHFSVYSCDVLCRSLGDTSNNSFYSSLRTTALEITSPIVHFPQRFG